MRSKRLPSQRVYGFTLPEIAVSSAVLAFLVILAGHFLNDAERTSRILRARATSDNHARQVFDRIAIDFAGMVQRRDVDAFFSKQEGNDKMFFYSKVPAYYSRDPAGSERSPLALVGYRINSKLQLERLGKGLTWDGDPTNTSKGGMNFLSYPTTGPRGRPLFETTIAGLWKKTVGSPPDFDGTDSDYHVLSTHVCRLEFSFLRRTTEGLSRIHSTIPFEENKRNASGLQDISAILVTIALSESHDPGSEISSAQLLAALPSPTKADLQTDRPQLVKTFWERRIKSESFEHDPGIPKRAIRALRIYERTFLLNHR